MKRKIQNNRLAFLNRFLKENKKYSMCKSNCLKSFRWSTFVRPYSTINAKEQLYDDTNIEVVFKYLKPNQMLQYAFEWEDTVEGRGFWMITNENYLESLAHLHSLILKKNEKN